MSAWVRLLLVGRFQVVTRAQLAAFARAATAPDVSSVLGIVTAADQAGTLRNPLPVAERRANLAALLEGLGRPVEIAEAVDVPAADAWWGHLRERVRQELGGALDAPTTRVLTANVDIARLARAAGAEVVAEPLGAPSPAAVLDALLWGGEWRAHLPEALVERFESRHVPERLARIAGRRARPGPAELTESRDFRTYGAAMDAALAAKLDDLAAFLRPGCIVDLGCGTGSLLEALSWRHRQSAFLGVDLSHELLERAQGLTYGAGDVDFVRADVATVALPDGCASSVIFCSILHEVYSYAGYSRERVRVALENAARMLAPGGRLLLRDGVRPPREDAVHLWCDDADHSPLGSTRERFERFAREFKGGPPAGGIPYREVARRFVLALPAANEFLTKKDYIQHWDLEVKEEFGVFSLEGWRQEVEAVGLRIVEARAYLSPWIAAHRYQGRCALLRAEGDGLVPEPYPDTHFVLAAERP